MPWEFSDLPLLVHGTFRGSTRDDLEPDPGPGGPESANE